MNYKLRALWSENAEFKENEEYTIKEFQDKTFRIDEKLFNAKEKGYHKLKFRLEFKDNLMDEIRTYEGRQDLGDGVGGFIDHIEDFGMAFIEPEEKSSSDFILNILVPQLRKQYRVELERIREKEKSI